MCLAPRRRLARTREAGVGLGSSMPASIGGYSSGAARSLLNSSAPALRKSDRCGVMTYPSAARDAAGSRTAPRPKVPKRSRRRPHASTVPGTVTVRMPRSGISSWPRDRTASMVASSPERPAPISPTGAVAPAGQTIAIRSPPIDVMCGYTTQRTAFAAITASTALPPSRSTCAPTSDAVLCGVAMTPLVTDGIIYGANSVDLAPNVPINRANSVDLAPHRRHFLPRQNSSWRDELDSTWLDFEESRQESHVLAVEVDAHLLR